MPLKAPDTHRVLVQYCDKCIGMLHVGTCLSPPSRLADPSLTCAPPPPPPPLSPLPAVREWNGEVEIALNARFNMDVVDRKFKKLNEQIEFLQNVIKEQEDEIHELKVGGVVWWWCDDRVIAGGECSYGGIMRWVPRMPHTHLCSHSF